MTSNMTALNPQRGVTSTAINRVGKLLARFDPGEPHPYRGPFTRWPRAADGVLALLVVAGSLISVAVSKLDDTETFALASVGDLPVGSIALLALAAAALMWRRQYPIAVAASILTLTIAWALVGYGDGHELALLVAIYNVGRYAADHRHSLATVIGAIAVSIIGTVIDPSQRVDIAPAFVLIGLLWYLGRLVRNRNDYLALLKDRAERLEAEQQARARQAVAEERARIARELHDVVAHRVSMMTVQAGAAKTIARDDLDSAIEAMGDVEQAGRQALGELRHLLGVLRPVTANSDQLGPQPGLAEIATLADQLTQTGAAVTLAIGDLPDDLPAALDLSGYRIVQESCTNIIKHAGRDPIVDIAVTVEEAMLVIDITNTTPTAAAHLPASGYGIAGMRERAALLGGTLTATRIELGRFRVHAQLPLKPEPT